MLGLAALLALAALAAMASLAAPASAHPGPHDPSTGVLTFEVGGDKNCSTKAPGSTCTKFNIKNCHGADAKLIGYYARSDPPGGVPVRGLLVIFSGGSGVSYWQQQAPNGSPEDQRIDSLLGDLRGAGFIIFQVRWATDWLAADAGQNDGLHMACRPGRIVRFIHDQKWQTLGIGNNTGACGFCLMGTSGESSSVAWQLTHFQTESFVDAIFPTGRLHAAMAKGCAPSGPAEAPYDYLGGSSVQQVDNPFRSGNGLHCKEHDTSFRPTWDAHSIDTPESGGDHDHPSTRVHLIDGGADPLRTHGYDWMLRMWAEPGPNPLTNFEIVPGAPHAVSGTDLSMTRLKTALLLTDTSRTERLQQRPGRRLGRRVDGSDPGCASTADASEKALLFECDNGLDDDGDGFVDFRTEFGTPDARAPQTPARAAAAAGPRSPSPTRASARATRGPRGSPCR